MQLRKQFAQAARDVIDNPLLVVGVRMGNISASVAPESIRRHGNHHRNRRSVPQHLHRNRVDVAVQPPIPLASVNAVQQQKQRHAIERFHSWRAEQQNVAATSQSLAAKIQEAQILIPWNRTRKLGIRKFFRHGIYTFPVSSGMAPKRPASFPSCAATISTFPHGVHACSFT